MIIFRCQASATVGMGHLVRCRVLAEHFLKKGFQCVMVGPPLSLQSPRDKELFPQWIEREAWVDSDTEADFHLKLAQQYGAKHFVLDDYRSDYEHQLVLRASGMRCLQQYDSSLKQKFAAELIINGSPYERRSFYEDKLFAPDIRMLLGPKYAILRSSFSKVASSVIKRNDILVAFGGGDDRGAIIKTLSAVAKEIPPSWRIVVVVGIQNKSVDGIRAWMKSNPSANVVLSRDPPNMEEIVAMSKVAVLGGGTTTFEAAMCGLPMILISIADNQHKQCLGWQELGCAKYLGSYLDVSEEKIAQTLMQVMAPLVLKKMSVKSREMVDGQGAERVVKALLEQ